MKIFSLRISAIVLLYTLFGICSVSSYAQKPASWLCLVDDEISTISFDANNITRDQRGNYVVWVETEFHTLEWQQYMTRTARSLWVLTGSKKGVGTHCVIDTDGTRYIMCDPTVVTYHAGYSRLDGREGCNGFTIGIEFQGNTLERPLTQDQISSAIEYLKPIIAHYHIPLTHIVTHEMVRKNYMEHHPKKRIAGKVDITQKEYRRFMKQLYHAYGKTF